MAVNTDLHRLSILHIALVFLALPLILVLLTTFLLSATALSITQSRIRSEELLADNAAGSVTLVAFVHVRLLEGFYFSRWTILPGIRHTP